METLRLEQPPEDDQVMPDELKREVAWLWVSLVTAYASLVPVTRPKPGAKRTPRTRARAVRTGGRSVIREMWGARNSMGGDSSCA